MTCRISNPTGKPKLLCRFGCGIYKPRTQCPSRVSDYGNSRGPMSKYGFRLRQQSGPNVQVGLPTRAPHVLPKSAPGTLLSMCDPYIRTGSARTLHTPTRHTSSNHKFSAWRPSYSYQVDLVRSRYYIAIPQLTTSCQPGGHYIRTKSPLFARPATSPYFCSPTLLADRLLLFRLWPTTPPHPQPYRTPITTRHPFRMPLVSVHPECTAICLSLSCAG